MLKNFLYKLRYKKANEELEMLIGFLENKSERNAALGSEIIENNPEEDKLTLKMNKLYAECKKLEKLLNSNEKLKFIEKR